MNTQYDHPTFRRLQTAADYEALIASIREALDRYMETRERLHALLQSAADDAGRCGDVLARHVEILGAMGCSHYVRAADVALDYLEHRHKALRALETEQP